MFFWLNDADLPEALCCGPRDHSFPARSVMRGERLPRDAVIFEENIGETAFDIVMGGHPSLDLWSERAMRVARANDITGLSSYPVEIRRDDGTVLKNYEGLAVTGKCGPIDDSRGTTEQRILVAGAPPYRYRVGLFIEQESWDGSDLFMPPNMDFMLCTCRLKSIFEDAGTQMWHLRRSSASRSPCCESRFCRVRFSGPDIPSNKQITGPLKRTLQSSLRLDLQ